MKRLLIILVDLLIIFGSILFCYKILGKYNLIENYNDNIEAFYIIAPAIGVLYLFLMYAFGLYNYTRRKWSDVVYTISLVSVSLMFGIMAVCFFIREGAMAFPRSILLLSFLFYWMLLLSWRSFLWKMARKKHGVKSVIIVGPEAHNLSLVLKKKYADIYEVKHIYKEDDKQLPDSIQSSELVFLTAGVTSKGRENILFWATRKDTGVYFVPQYRDVMIMSASLQKTDDIPTFYIDSMGLTLEERFVKRAVDLILGSIGFIIFLPFGIISALLVKLDGGPIFYAQERLTRNGNVFRVLKFRSMVPNAEKLSGPVLAGENDPRITKVGKLMRATRMDEIPQILNILKGDMSIVGPRPERPFFTDKFCEQTPQYAGRMKVKAGLTGLAQVEGKYNTSFEDKLRYDLLYISNYSLFQDFLIILQTVKILFMKESTEGVELTKEQQSTEQQPMTKYVEIGRNYTGFAKQKMNESVEEI